MKITVIGTGYVGLVSGACFAENGTEVVCIDVDATKIENLKKGIMPIYEPGLEDMVLRNQQAGRLLFSTNLESVLSQPIELVFCAVGTPQGEDGSADLKHVEAVARNVGKYMSDYLVFVTKSTVPVGTHKMVKQTIQEELDKRGSSLKFDVASNPEFLKEGAAIKDFMSPDRVVVGVDSEKAKSLMTRLYRPFLLNNFRVIFMDILSAEMTKYAANAMLATRISFMNDIANLCELVGADVNMVRKGIGSDPRIGNKFLYAGLGYGGSCFPKDVKALIKTAGNLNYELSILKAVEEVNNRQKQVMFKKLLSYFQKKENKPGDTNVLAGKTIALWGLAFKAETDDMREAPSLVIIRQLQEAGCSIRVYDPVAMEEAKRSLGDSVTYGKDIYDAVLGADALILVTEWKEFRLPSWAVVRKLMNQAILFDGRNIYEESELLEAGFSYECIGKSPSN